jgi:hypothetical protein
VPRVNDLYEALVQGGYTPKDAAKEAQARTGASVVTGRTIKPKSVNWKKNFKQFKKTHKGLYG